MLSYFGWGSSSKSDSKISTVSGNSESKPESESSSPASTTVQSQAIQKPVTQDNTSLKILVGGVAFVSLSLLITRRANRRKIAECIPPFYSSSTYFQPQVNGAGEALEALSLATINVLSFSTMAVGAGAYAFNINSLDDARRAMRTYMDTAVDSSGKADEELEKDVTEWVTNMLGDRFQKQLEIERAKKAQNPPSGDEK
ncbi:hypothetical protein N7495_009608 [Penicillium taxi]|uniref:uncharacterized protein n=1 Tax=Penicillium taxi TaxID=168475 RepID=UPI00254560D3|nr:uncharacterized protein N7495_009608 [Penicillium taxi]KAJ5885098.1 hypothetical protein N7495_009608 [Penicillium taxi]